MNPKELREKRANIVADMQSFNDKVESEKRDFTAEETSKWEEYNKEIDALDAKISRLEQLDKLQASVDSRQEEVPGKQNVDHAPNQKRSAEELAELRANVLQGWARFNTKVGVEQKHTDAAKELGFDLSANVIDIRLCDFAPRNIKDIEGRALSGLDGSAGGLTVPSTFVRTYERALLAFGGMRQVANVIRTGTGEDMYWPSSDDTSNTGEIVGESKEVSEQDITFDVTKWGSYNFSSKMVKVPYTLIRDSALNLSQILGSMLGERLGRIQNTRFTTGNGASQPYGITARATTGVTSSSATAIAADELIDLEHSVDIAYRANSNWMFNDAIVKYLRKLKDGEGRYIWQPGMQTGVPNTLNGRSYTVNNDMASTVVASAITMLFGDFSYYKIRDVGTIRLKRLVERYAEYDQIAFIAFMSADGNLLDAGTHPVKKLVQHS